MRTNTLKKHLLKKLSAPILILLLVIGSFVYWSAKDEIYDVYDSQLIVAANVLSVMHSGSNEKETSVEIDLRHMDADLGDIDKDSVEDYAKWRYFRIWKKGKLVISSDNARPENIPPEAKGFSTIKRKNGSSWRVFALYATENDTIVEVAENINARYNAIVNILEGVFWPLLFALPIFAILIWRGLNKGLNDVTRFAQDIKQRSSNDLSKLKENVVFDELLPLCQGINQLLHKLEKSISYERLFTDNITHELRTPLAALQIQADVILNSKNIKQRKEAITDLAMGITRISRLLDQLLTLAQLRDKDIVLKKIKPYLIAKEVIKELHTNTVKKDINIKLSGEKTLEVVSQDELLFTLIGNIIDNAIKYSPERSNINILLKMEDKVPVIVITDSGPGIPESEYENVFHRFYRLPNNQKTGSGLGLAIVKQIAELLNIKVTLFLPDNNGLGVKLIFIGNNNDNLRRTDI